MLRVVGASFGRTGTTSARLALEALGFGPVHYMRALFADERHAAGWLRAVDGERDWARLLRTYRSTIAWPAAYFWRELAAAYPDARVLLLRRDADAWYDSMRRTLWRTRPDTPTIVRDRAIEAIVWRGVFGGRFTDRARAIELYRAQLAAVRREIAPERLVEADVADGWAPLCAGLGVPVPAAPFPHANTTSEYVARAGRAGAL